MPDKRMTRQLYAPLLLLLAMIAQAAHADEPTRSFSYAKTGEPIFTYSVSPALITKEEPQPRLRVYANGRVLVHYPSYHVRAGSYETWLNDRQLRALMNDMSEVVDFNREGTQRAVRKSLASKIDAGESLPLRTDATTETFAIALDDYQASASDEPRRIRQQASWTNIAFQAEQYPEVNELQNLRRAQKRIQKLLDREDLKPL